MSVDTLAFDIGGTSTRSALFREHHLDAYAETWTPNTWTHPSGSADDIRDALFQTLKRLGDHVLGRSRPQEVVVAFPGPINRDGLVLSAPTIWGDRDAQPFPITEAIQEIWPWCDVLVLNDVTAAGYYFVNSYENFLIVTVSSGIGSKVFLNGHPVVGGGGRGGEIGHVRVDFSASAPMCECGGTGHLAAFASGRAPYVVDGGGCHSYEAGGSADNHDPVWKRNRQLIARIKSGDRDASDIVRAMAGKLGSAIAMIDAALGLDKIIIFGGFAQAVGEPYRRAVVDAVAASWLQERDWDDAIVLNKQRHISLYGALAASECMRECAEPRGH
jgi:glucokinase